MNYPTTHMRRLSNQLNGKKSAGDCWLAFWRWFQCAMFSIFMGVVIGHCLIEV